MKKRWFGIVVILVLSVLIFSINSNAQSIPTDKYVHLTNGMSEAEVLQRFGPPTTVSYGGTRTTGTVGSRGSVDLRSTETRIFNYIGGQNEWTTIIYIQGGRVVDYKRIR